MDPKDTFYSVGIAVTLLLGVWNLIAQFRAGRKTGFINTVTSQRIKWIEQLLQDLGAFCGLIYAWRSSSNLTTDKERNLLREIRRLCTVIQPRLNPHATLDHQIQSSVLQLSDPSQINTVNWDEAIRKVVDLSQKMLKEEWDKVVAESEEGKLKKKRARRRSTNRAHESWIRQLRRHIWIAPRSFTPCLTKSGTRTIFLALNW